MTLSLGQAQRTTCAVCGMSYHLSTPSDQQTHARFHARALAGLTLPACTRGLVPVWRAGAHAVLRATAAERRRVRDVLELVDTELGAAPIDDAALWGADGRYRVFLYTVEERARRTVVGCLLAERIAEGFAAVGGAGDVRLGPRRRAVMGVCRVWVAREWRRKGIAWKMLEAARGAFVYGMKVRRSEVAFSQPTESGGWLARAWGRGMRGGFDDITNSAKDTVDAKGTDTKSTDADDTDAKVASSKDNPETKAVETNLVEDPNGGKDNAVKPADAGAKQDLDEWLVYVEQE